MNLSSLNVFIYRLILYYYAFVLQKLNKILLAISLQFSFITKPNFNEEMEVSNVKIKHKRFDL